MDVCVQVTCGPACAFPWERHLQGWGCRARTCVLPTCEYSCWRENQQINHLKLTDLAKLPFKKVVPICFYTGYEHLPPHFLRHEALANILILVRRIWGKKCVRCLYFLNHNWSGTQFFKCSHLLFLFLIACFFLCLLFCWVICLLLT